MKQPRKTDSQIVGHARRELEMAGLFTVNKENDYDGFIGKGVLAMVKLFDEWTGDNPQKMQAIQSVFNYVIAGDLLSPPTNDPDEWKILTSMARLFAAISATSCTSPVTMAGPGTIFGLRPREFVMIITPVSR